MKFLFPLLALACLYPGCSGAVALLLGVAVALTMGNPYLDLTRKLTPRILSFSVVGLGAGMNLKVVGQVGLHGLGYTMIGISTALCLGTLLGILLKTEKNTSLLISVGTAICGGSAIAAVAPAIRARDTEVSVALATVFILNAVALLIFPWVGHSFHLTETQFGLWSALAIHDTSSVVGATLQYGSQALSVGTTVKLARALWIVPVTFGAGWIQSMAKGSNKRSAPKRPWFILGFLAAAALVTFVPELQSVGHLVEAWAKRALVITLFLIGAGLTRATLRAVGVRPLIQGVTLWLLVASATLGAVLAGWIA